MDKLTTHKQNQAKRLFLIDGSALAYRSYFAFQGRPLTDSRGRNLSAVYGFMSALFAIVNRENPNSLVIAFDTKAPTFRHKIYPEYKATRQKMPEDMADQLPILRETLEASGIPIMEMEGYEADDLMGTAALLAERAGYEILLVTGDKDFFQLVNDRVKVYNLRKSAADPEIIGPDEVVVKFGVPPEKVIEVLGLMGDSSDHVPGVKGIGPKGAVELVNQFGDIDSVLEHIEEVKGSQKAKLEAGKESALFSRRLVTIKTDCPIDFDLERWKFKLDHNALRKKFRELEFISLLKNLEEEKSEPRKVEYLTVDTPEMLSSLVEKLEKAELFAFDTETTSEEPMRAKLVGLSFSTKEGEAYYIPANAFKLDERTPVDRRYQWFGEDTGRETSYILSKLGSVLENPARQKCAQNGKYDIIVLANYGILVKGLVFDTMVAAYLLDPGSRGFNLDALSLKYLNLTKIPTSDLIGSGAKQTTMDKVPVEKVSYYACEDADCAFSLTLLLRSELEKSSLRELFDKVEIPLIPALVALERNGVAIDRDFLSQMSVELKERIQEKEKEIHRLAGVEFNINSPKQLSEILFEKLNLPVIRKTKTGPSTDVSVLKKLAAMDPLPNEILYYRSLAKLKGTYVDALPKLVNPHTGRVHTSFNQTVAATGRLSSSNPNLQNIPIRTEIGGRIRQAFVPDNEGWTILSADYSQIELRILAHFSGDPELLESFNKGVDIHRRTASLIFNTPLELVDENMRRSAKEVNFGVIYGMRDFGLSERLGIPRRRAKEFIDSYFDNYPNILSFIESTIEEARKTEEVFTILRRRRRIPEIKSKNHNARQNAERIAINTPIQGSAADMIKIAMINVHNRMLKENMRSMMIMQVHDELLFEVHPDEAEKMKRLVVEEMENALPLSLPVKVDASFGANWLEAH